MGWGRECIPDQFESEEGGWRRTTRQEEEEASGEGEGGGQGEGGAGGLYRCNADSMRVSNFGSGIGTSAGIVSSLLRMPACLVRILHCYSSPPSHALLVRALASPLRLRPHPPSRSSTLHTLAPFCPFSSSPSSSSS
eukprot:746275-Hanusia_phi.AAC.3